MKKIYIISILATMLLSGCISDMFAPKEDPTQFYLLREKVDKRVSDKAVEMNILPIILPSYTSRNQIVSVQGDNAMIVSDINRWGEPLEDGVLRVVYLDMSNLFGKSSKLYAYSFAPYNQNAQSLKISIYKLIGKISGKTYMKASWVFWGAKDSKILASGEFEKTIENGTTYATYVDSISVLLGDLSKTIAEEISKNEQDKNSK